jgi:hypothetical protein
MYFDVEPQGTLGMLGSLEALPVMTKDELVEVLDDFGLYLDEQIVAPAAAELASALERLIPRPRHLSEMFGEYLREAAVLVLIFVPLDLLVPKANYLRPKWLALTLLLSLGAFSLGAWLERRK